MRTYIKYTNGPGNDNTGAPAQVESAVIGVTVGSVNGTPAKPLHIGG